MLSKNKKYILQNILKGVPQEKYYISMPAIMDCRGCNRLKFVNARRAGRKVPRCEAFDDHQEYQNDENDLSGKTYLEIYPVARCRSEIRFLQENKIK